MSLRKFWTAFRNIKIVKFSDGTYGIRKGWVFYKYVQGDYYPKKRWDSLQYKDDFSRFNFSKERQFEACCKFYDATFIDTGTPIEFERIYTEIQDND